MKSVFFSVILHFVFSFGAFLFIHEKNYENTIQKPESQNPVFVEWVDEPEIKNQIVQTDLVEKSKKPKEDAFLGLQTQVVDKQEIQTKKSNSGIQESKPKSLANLGVGIQPMNLKSSSSDPNLSNHSGASEYLENMTEGAQTLLNTKEYLYFTYFERIRKRLDEAWRPLLKERVDRIVSSGQVLRSDQNYNTQTIVTLNEKGHVVRVSIQGQSGRQELDDTAVQAFNEAGPFPNPPKELLGERGFVEIKWDFILRT